MPLSMNLTEASAKRRLRIDFFLGLAAACAAAIVLFLFEPGKSSLYPPCLFHRLTGLYCPGCGTLRALAALLHGRLAEAFGLNPLMVILLPYVALVYGSFGWEALKGARPRLRQEVDRWLTPRVAFAVIMVYWALRNIPARPFAWLAP